MHQTQTHNTSTCTKPKPTTLPPITHPQHCQEKQEDFFRAFAVKILCDLDNAVALNIIAKGLVEAHFFNKPLAMPFAFSDNLKCQIPS